MDLSRPDDSTDGSTADRLAPWLLGAYLLLGFVLLVFWAGRDDWFSFGDWHYLAGPATRDIWKPVEQHWSTVPVLLFQGYLRLFGLEYFPFLVTVVALHIGVVALLWRVTVRAGVRTWVAGLAVAPLVLFGPGYLSLIFPIQITQNLSLLFGLAQLLLADHGGKVGRRDWLGLGAGAVGLMSSGVMPLLVFATGLATLIRRGWRAAAFHTAPLAAMYLAWFWVADPLRQDGWYKAHVYSPAAHWAFVERGLVASLRALCGSDWAAASLVVVVVAGLALRLSRQGVRRGVTASAAPLALLVCAPLYLALVGYQRSNSGVDYAEMSHHLYTTLVLAIPAVAVAAGELVRRWSWTAVVFGAAVAASVVVTADFAPETRRFDVRPDYLKRMETIVKELAASPALDFAVVNGPDRILVFNAFYTRDLTPRWLAENRDAGRIPPPVSSPDVNPADFAQVFHRRCPTPMSENCWK